ncbi:MAG: helix-turn-helix domain-containing protein [Lachnospiraceae bacterium]|nr:helix-turn-helix domain-containing protein [Lachnospiraceae bacterium]
MSYAYSELYISLAQRVMGDMFDFAVNTLGYKLRSFYDMFVVSGMARQIERGNPTFIAGKNGCEVARTVLEWSGVSNPDIEDIMYLDKSEEYWIGWSLAYYQWKRNCRFRDIDKAVPVEELYALYGTLHEADVSIFVDIVDARMEKYRDVTQLKRLRSYARLSQTHLAKSAEVPLRQIQMFEQGQRDINKTQAQTLQKLAHSLGCSMEDLLEQEEVKQDELQS